MAFIFGGYQLHVLEISVTFFVLEWEQLICRASLWWDI